VPGRIGDPGHGDVPGATTATSAASAGARARLLRPAKQTGPAQAFAWAGFVLSIERSRAVPADLVTRELANAARWGVNQLFDANCGAARSQP